MGEQAETQAGGNGARPLRFDDRAGFVRLDACLREGRPPDVVYQQNGHRARDKVPLGGEPGRPLGIALSGGGIRSAAYCLGALQAFQKVGWLRDEKEHADFLSAVSGGSYIAGAVALAALGPVPAPAAVGVERSRLGHVRRFLWVTLTLPARFLAGVLRRSILLAGRARNPLRQARGPEPMPAPARTPIAADDPYAPGSPEEQYLRNHLLYLTEAPGGLAGVIARVVLGFSFNLAFIALVIFLVAFPLGWVYGWAFDGLRAHPPGCRLPGSRCPVNLDVGFTLKLAVVAAAVALLAGWSVVAMRWHDEHRRDDAYLIAFVAAVVGGALLLFGVALPELLQVIRNATAPKPETAAARSTMKLLLTSAGGLAGLAGTLFLALRSGVAEVDKATEPLGAVRKRVASLAARLKTPALNAGAALLGPLFALAIFLTFLNIGAARTPLGGNGGLIEWLALAGAVALGGLLWMRADLVAWSLHPVYKRRLARAFALRRFRWDDGQEGAEEIPYGALPSLSQSQPRNFPQLLISAAVNVSDYGKTPAGSHVAGFVFRADRVGGPLTGWWPTAELEQLQNRGGRRDLTLMTAVAITGAAVSPSMGKMTRRPLRFLIGLVNLRLGVWVPNPLRRPSFARNFGLADAVGDEQEAGQVPGESANGHGGAGTASTQANLGRTSKPVFARPDYFLRELLGRNELSAKFLYASDGGHYENLGLVELLRLGCKEVWCVDASGDSVRTFSTLGQAIALARAEHLVDGIAINPLPMAPADDQDPPVAGDTYVEGTIVYPGGETGRLVVIKAGVPADAPWDVRAFQRRKPLFPCDSTANQLYTAERFEAYRALGYYATARALTGVLGAVFRDVDMQSTPATSVASAPGDLTANEPARAPG